MWWLFTFATLLASAHGWSEEKVLSISGEPGQWTFELSSTEFNTKFWASSGIIKRTCSSCLVTHQEIYYKRKTDLKTFNAYNVFHGIWSSSNNILNDDFELYGSLADLEAGTNQWTYCNFDGVGPFRDCGPSSKINGQWVAVGKGANTAEFYMLTECADNDECDDGDLCNGDEACVDSVCQTATDFECPTDYLCSTAQQKCVLDCDTFAIDEYLVDCSPEFDTVKADIVQSVGTGDDNAEAIAALQVTLQELQSSVQAHDDVLAEVAAVLAQFDSDSNSSELSVPVPFLVVVTALLVLLNIALLVNNFCKQGSGGRKRYQVVDRDSSADELQHLQRVPN